MKYFLSLLLIMAIGLTCCTNSTETTTGDLNNEEQKIKELFTSWVEDVSENMDPDTYFKYVTNDFILSEPGTPAKPNDETLKTELIEFVNSYESIRLKDWNSEEIIIRDDIAIHRHSGVLVLQPKGDSLIMEVSLKYLDVLKKNEDGEWKVYIHSNMPNK
ncbi:YybH family protein [Marinigracilibium pacificum]|uniref:DUF4440 domain-containing protein n=1 Tax=Marinigracilibium pacificum TaxID=2729599 RepID=A0A848J3G9_9BACT|nr:DUF4440 domain-containing protein [Marinigracilibium pacificum]NMM47722.1 hypothetical protein [Marinigracilibium pacificum]